MHKPLSLHPSASQELSDTDEWYENEKIGLGTRFLNAVDKVFQEIESNPMRYGVFKGDVRAADVLGFRYVVYYRERTNVIRILAVQHGARDPSNWQRRR